MAEERTLETLLEKINNSRHRKELQRENNGEKRKASNDLMEEMTEENTTRLYCQRHFESS